MKYDNTVYGVGGSASPEDNCDVIEGISVPRNVEQVTDVSHFQDEATICADVDGRYMSTGIKSDGDINDLKRYMSRPHLQTTGTFTTSAGRQYAYSVITQPNWRDIVSSQTYNRLAGSMGMRATICFRVVVSSTPFNQGVLCLNWQYGNTTTASINGLRCNFNALCVNLPHVMLDISENTAAELKVPFVYCSEYFPFSETGEVGNPEAYGIFAINALTPLRTGPGTASPNYVVYSWFEDVELIGARDPVLSQVTLQSGSSEKVKAGIVSNILDSAAGLTRSVGRIPALSSIMKTPAWFLSNASNVAAAFGYSKPVNSQPHMRVVDDAYRYDSQIDVPTPAILAGPFQTNALVVDGSVGCTDVDEMAFDNILTRPQLIYRDEITSAQVPGNVIYGCVVSPSSFWYREGGAGNVGLPGTATLTTNSFLPSTLMYVGSNFRYWRGSYKFRFQFSKSKLHGGRVLIAYTPSNKQYASAIGATTVDLPASATMEGYSKVFDLKDGSVVEFEVPYTFILPYAGFYDSIGTISVSIVNSLQTPGPSATTIDMLVYVMANEGYEFAGVVPSTLEATNPLSDQRTAGIYLQSGGATISDVSAHVIGEKFRSVKQLMMIPDWNILDVINATASEYTLVPYFKKWFIPVVSGSTAIPDASQAVYYASKSGRVSEMYAYANGSTLWTLFHDHKNANGLSLSVSQRPNDAAANVTGVADLYNRNSLLDSGFRILTTDNTLRVNVPAYTKLLRIPFYLFNSVTGYTSTSLPSTITGATSVHRVGYSHQTFARVRNNSGSTVRLAFGRAAGDDAYCSQFIGPPVCNLWQSTKATSPNPSLGAF